MEIRNDIINTIKNTLEEDGIEFSYKDDEIFDFEIPVSVRKWRCNGVGCRILVLDKAFIVYGISSNSVDCRDDDMVNATARSICRINYGMHNNGNFEMNLRDGEIRYRLFVDCSGRRLTKEMVRYSISCAGGRLREFDEEMAVRWRRQKKPEEAASGDGSYIERPDSVGNNHQGNAAGKNAANASDTDADIDAMFARIEARFRDVPEENGRKNVKDNENYSYKTNLFNKKGDVE